MSDRPAAKIPLATIFMTIFLDLLGFGLIVPVAPYYALEYHASQTQVALLGTTFSTMQFLFLPLWGRLSDRIGRRPVLLASTLGCAVALFVFGAAPSLIWLFVARGMSGMMSANIAVAQAYIADTTTGENRARGMGIVGAAFGLGFLLGPLAGGQLAAIGRGMGLGYSLVGYGAASMSLINFIFVWVFLPETNVRKSTLRGANLQAFKDALAVPGMAALFIVFFAATFAFANMEWTFALLTSERLGWTDAVAGPRNNSYVFGVVGITAAITQGLLVGRLAPRFGEKKLLLAGVLLIAGGFFSLSVLHNPLQLFLTVPFIAGGNSLCNPTLASLVSRRAPKELQGSILGVHQSIGALARVVGPACGGFLFQHAGSAWPYRVGTFGMLVAFGLGLTQIAAMAAPGAPRETSS